jgi:predicted dehydrogenase
VIRWGIWGTGAIANLVASDFRQVSGAELHAVASRNLVHAQSFAGRHGIAKSYQGLEALLNDAQVDVVYVASPNHRHLDDCLACIHAGKAVMCEKPFALDLDEARRIVEAARSRNIFCMEAMWTRFIPAVREAKRYVDEGAVGAIRLMQGNFAYAAPAGSEARFFDAQRGGGALLDRGVYLISLAQHLLGAPIAIHGTSSVGQTGVDEQSAYQLVYADGALANFTASLRVRGGNEVEICGERGLLRLCEPFYAPHRIIFQPSAPPAPLVREDSSAKPGGVRKLTGAPAVKLLRRRLSPLVDVLRGKRSRKFLFSGNGYQFELLHVNECLRQGRTESTIMSLDDSLEVMRTMDAIRSQMDPAHPTPAKPNSPVATL